MSRRKKRETPPNACEPAAEAAPPVRWAPPVTRRWQLTLAACSVAAWLAVLAYLAANYGG